MISVRARPQHRRKPRAHRMQHALAQFARHRAVGERNRLAVGEFQGADVERVGAAVFGQEAADHAVAAAAFERVEIVEHADVAAEARGQRRDVGADPVGDRGGHGAAQDRRGLQRNLPLVRQHHRLQPHQILAAAAAGAVDVGNAGGNGDRIGQRQPAGRGRRRPRRSRRFGRLVRLGRCRRLLRGARASPARSPARPPDAALATAPLRVARPGAAFAGAAPNRSPQGPCDHGAGLFAAAGSVGAPSVSQHRGGGNHDGRRGAAGAATRPFAACFLRAKVHGNSVRNCAQAITLSGGTSVCVD